MASSDYESESFSNDTEPSPPQKGTSLQPAEIEILEAELESWKNADRNKRSSIMLTLRNKIKNLDVNVTLKTHEWVQKKKAIQTWLYNHGRSRSRRALIKYGGGWTLRKVVMHHQKKSINKVLEEAGIKQGSAEMIKSYQKAVDTVMKSLTAEEIQEAEALAIEWNERQPPRDVQSEAAEKKGRKYAEEFAKEMWKRCGARVVVMAAWEDANGEVIVGAHDFNDELGNGKLFEDLDECRDKFVKYARTAFGNGGTNAESPDEDAASQSRPRKRNGKPKTVLPVSDNGTPYIPNILDMRAPKLKDIMQTFVTFHYRKACRNSQATVPWSAIMTNTALYIAPQFLPPEVPFKEPSRLTQDELTAILEWWQERKEWHPNNICSFKKWRDARGSLRMPVAAADRSGVRMGATQDLDGTPDNSEGERTMDRMMRGRRKQQRQTVVGSDSDDESNRQQIPSTLPSNGNDDAAEAVALPDSQRRIAGSRAAEGDTCRPFAIGKEQPNAWPQVVGSTSSAVQPMTEGRRYDSPDSLQPAEPLAVPTTIKSAHKQEDSKCKLPIPLMMPTHRTGIDNASGMRQSKRVRKAPKRPDDDVPTPSPYKKRRRC
ncbi:hypothetical protein BKA82DRAFT_4021989 [Pisolithus tinctorius]|nr:hypothetical protein BKA82DRAFT_4021989 [Pisolithus tinctorius]